MALFVPLFVKKASLCTHTLAAQMVLLHPSSFPPSLPPSWRLLCCLATGQGQPIKFSPLSSFCLLSLFLSFPVCEFRANWTFALCSPGSTTGRATDYRVSTNIDLDNPIAAAFSLSPLLERKCTSPAFTSSCPSSSPGSQFGSFPFVFSTPICFWAFFHSPTLQHPSQQPGLVFFHPFHSSGTFLS